MGKAVRAAEEKKGKRHGCDDQGRGQSDQSQQQQQQDEQKHQKLSLSLSSDRAAGAEHTALEHTVTSSIVELSASVLPVWKGGAFLKGIQDNCHTFP